MTQTSRILVAVDGSKVSRRAFQYALDRAAADGAELVVVHVVPRTQAFDRHATERRALVAALQQEAERAQVAFSVKVQHGDPADTVLLHVRTLRPDLVVLGTDQRRGLQRLRAGSVAGRIAAGAAVPVLVVPAHGREPVTSPSRHVAVAVDFAAASQRALDEAQSLASGAGDRITLIHVVPGFSGGMPPHYYRYGQAEYQRGLMQDARERVRQIVAEMRTVATVDAKVLVGDTATEISRVVSGIGADLLVVGLPRRGLVSRAVFGTTAGRLWTKLTVPMLAVPEMTAAASLQTAA